MFRGLDIATTGLSAQRMRMETIATNIANAETTRGPDGTPYKRRVVQLEAAQAEGAPPSYPPLPLDQAKDSVALPDPSAPLGGVQVVGIGEDQSEGRLVYDPGHPDANAQGYVRYPNVRITDEMVDLMEALKASLEGKVKARKADDKRADKATRKPAKASPRKAKKVAAKAASAEKKRKTG